MSNMITMQPIRIREAQIANPTVPYPDAGEQLWQAGVVYVVDNTVSFLIDNLYHRFLCKKDHTSANDSKPEAFPNDEKNQFWIDLGAVNQLAMFQLERNTQTVSASPLAVEVQPNERVGNVAIGNIVADRVLLEVFDENDALLKSEEKVLLERNATNAYEYFFRPFRQVKDTLFSDLPLNTTNKFKLTFTKSSGDIKVGSVVAGVPFEIGRAQIRAKVGRLNFSSFKREFDGEVKIIVRRNVPRINLKLHIKKWQLDGVRQMIDDLDGVVTVWSGLVQTNHGYFESLFVIGLCKEVRYSLDYPDDLFADILIEGV